MGALFVSFYKRVESVEQKCVTACAKRISTGTWPPLVASQYNPAKPLNTILSLQTLTPTKHLQASLIAGDTKLGTSEYIPAGT